jgi:hypothetical protein
LLLGKGLVTGNRLFGLNLRRCGGCLDFAQGVEAGHEGLGLLALQETSLRDEAEEMIERFLREGTKAMKSRVRHVKRELAKKYRVS